MAELSKRKTLKKGELCGVGQTRPSKNKKKSKSENGRGDQGNLGSRKKGKTKWGVEKNQKEKEKKLTKKKVPGDQFKNNGVEGAEIPRMGRRGIKKKVPAIHQRKGHQG